MSVTTATELWRMSATELAEAIRSRQASSREVIEAHLRRIEAVNPAVNAVTVVLGEQALEAAKAADRAAAGGGDLPPLHGVPFTVKENIDLAGTPTTQGSRRWRARIRAGTPPSSSGCGPPGRSRSAAPTCPTFAIRWHTDSELWGATVNPWDRSRTPGASSGGEAAALATGMSPLGLGNDGLGSLRWPAQCCGISALKPTLGRIPHATTIEPVDAPISIQLTGRRGPAGAAGRRPAGRLRGDGRAELARPVDGARTAARPRTGQARPGRPRDRPGRPGHRQTGAGRCPEGGQRPGRRRLRRRRGRAAVDRRWRPRPCWTCSTPPTSGRGGSSCRR